MEQIDQGAALPGGGTLVSVSGLGTAIGPPDVAHVWVGVQVQAETAAEAAGSAAGRMSQVLAALHAEGLSGDELRTTSLQVGLVHQPIPPRPDSPRRRADELEPARYSATHSLAVTVTDLGRLGALVDRVVAAGATNIDGIHFGVRDAVALEHLALSRAITAARAKADLIAEQLGLRVAGVERVEETFARTNGERRLMAVYNSNPTPIEPGACTTTAQVQAVFRLQ